ncbi:MAG: hypothetical protein IJ375_05290 [Oscillospiraceae bacterium]|nr:hypothetical protein [Oscillospiraceae bacterium]
MKKYVKPELFYERFELSQHIADCAWELQLASKEACIAQGDPEMGMGSLGTLFTTLQSCYNKTDEGYQAYCYTNGTAGVNVFRS